jgi:hypothetical protein
MRFEGLGKWVVRLGTASLTLLSSSLAFAQGCTMCYNNAAATKASGQQALRSGILILMFPPLVMLAGIFVAALRRRNKFFGDDAPLLELNEAGDGTATSAGSRARRSPAEFRSSFVPSLTSARTTDELSSEDLP